jgi:hypothetical protein
VIINSSRAQDFLGCKKRTFNRYHHRLESPTRSMNLTDGGAAHLAIAHGLATKDWDAGLVEARKQFDLDIASSAILPEEQALAEDHWDLIKTMVTALREGFEGEDYQIIQPECEFDVELPDSRHHCIFIHWFDIDDAESAEPRVGPPDPISILEKRVVQCQCEACYVPHRLVGKTDALVAWKNNIWLQDHKTTAILGQQFFDGFLLDRQLTTYMYGVWRATSVRPSGFIINAIYKPSEAQVAGWNKKRKSGALQQKDYVRYEREAFLRSPEDLMRCEAQYIDLCNEWEERIISGRWPMSDIKTMCMSYNRRCDYFDMCLDHDSENSMEGLVNKAKTDYVEDKLVILQGERKRI